MVKESVNICDKFKNLYNTVFDSNGNIKACGRESCIDLIIVSGQIDGTVYYGNSDTGVMNVANISKLYNSLK